MLTMLMLVSCASLYAYDKSTLIDNSPFIPPGVTRQPKTPPQPPPPRNDPQIQNLIEFRGYTAHEGKWYFSIVERRNGQRHLVSLNEPTGALIVKNFNEKDRRIQVSYEGAFAWINMNERNNARRAAPTVANPVVSNQPNLPATPQATSQEQGTVVRRANMPQPKTTPLPQAQSEIIQNIQKTEMERRALIEKLQQMKREQQQQQ